MVSGITSVDCPARANCAVSGGYVDRGFNFFVFAGSQHAGTWGRAAVLPGNAALVGNSGKADKYPLLSGDFLSQVACSSAGNCAVAGNYQAKDLSQASAPLLGIERGGRWAKVQPLSGAARALLAVSCPPATGHCAAGGATAKGAFVIDEHGGTWTRYQTLAGAKWPVTAMSCPAAGTCLAAGGANPRGGEASPSTQPFILNTDGIAVTNSVSCSRTSCAAGGYYSSKSHQGSTQGFLATEHGGTWGDAKPVPGLAKLNTDGNARVDAVSCAPDGYCAAIGEYASGSWCRGGLIRATAARRCSR